MKARILLAIYAMPLRERTSLRRHIRTVHEKIKKTYKCELCGKSLCSLAYLKTHHETVHEGLRKFNCELCSKDFAHKEGYLSHLRSIHEGQKLQCECCEKNFAQRVQLRRHITQ